MASQFKKYDRQLRMWGAEGQEHLTQSNLCVLGSGALATETLKNLVLPGVGRFTIVDDAVVTEADVGNNFFVTHEDVGKPRAEVVAGFLKELNPDDVEGNFVIENPATLISSRADFFSNFTLVLCASPAVTASHITTLEGLLGQSANSTATDGDVASRESGDGKSKPSGSAPLVVCRVNGLFGVITTCGRNHTVIESKPDFAVEDLRLATAFPALIALANSTQISPQHAATPEEAVANHNHIPYPLILLKALSLWEAEHGSKPSTSDEKRQFREFVQSCSINFQDEENFQEAVKNSNKLFITPSVKSTTREILGNARCDSSNENFWIVAAAVRNFHATHNQLPLTGSIPDMVSDSKSFVSLQAAYKQKAEADVDEVHKEVNNILSARGLPNDSVPRSYVARMCQHVHDWVHVDFGGFHSYTNLAPQCSKDIAGMLEDPSSAYHVLVALWATEHFVEKHGRVPGVATCDDSEQALFSQSVADVASALGWRTNNTSADLVAEMCRAGGSELHTTASVVGGVASQEIIKLITHQFVPANNTFVYNGVFGTTATMRLF